MWSDEWKPKTFLRVERYFDISTGAERDVPRHTESGNWIALISEGSPPKFCCMVDLIAWRHDIQNGCGRHENHQCGPWDVCVEDGRHHQDPRRTYYPVAVNDSIDVAMEEGLKILRQWLDEPGDKCTKVPPGTCGWGDL